MNMVILPTRSTLIFSSQNAVKSVVSVFWYIALLIIKPSDPKYMQCMLLLKMWWACHSCGSTAQAQQLILGTRSWGAKAAVILSEQAILSLSGVAGESSLNQPSCPASFLAEYTASLRANITEAPKKKGGSPTALEEWTWESRWSLRAVFAGNRCETLPSWLSKAFRDHQTGSLQVDSNGGSTEVIRVLFPSASEWQYVLKRLDDRKPYLRSAMAGSIPQKGHSEVDGDVVGSWNLVSSCKAAIPQLTS